MPVVAGQVTSYDVMGKPRDLMDIIFDISPTDTPFLTMCKRGEATQTTHEWTTDELAPPGDNAQVDGDDTTSFEGSNVNELRNLTQILKKAVKVSGTAQSIKQAGLSNQYKYQLAQRMKEVKKDAEYALLGNTVAVVGNKTTARKMRGLPAYIIKNVNLGDGGAVANLGTGGLGGTAATPGTPRELTEDMLRDVLLQCYESGGNVDRMMAAPLVRSQVSKLLRSESKRTDNIKDTEITATVEVYVGDYGNIKIVPNRVQTFVPYSKNAVFLLDPEYWGAAYLQGRGFREERLARTGDNEKGHILCEMTLEARQADSSGMIADITVTPTAPGP